MEGTGSQLLCPVEVKLAMKRFDIFSLIVFALMLDDMHVSGECCHFGKSIGGEREGEKERAKVLH